MKFRLKDIATRHKSSTPILTIPHFPCRNDKLDVRYLLAATVQRAVEEPGVQSFEIVPHEA